MHLSWAGSAAAGAVPGSLGPGSVTGPGLALTALCVVLASQPCLGAVGAVRRRVKEWPAGSA